MKKIKLLLVVFLLTSGFSFQQLAAQEKTKEEQEKELQIQKAIDEQKKAMTDQKKAQEEADAALLDEKAKLDHIMKEVQINVDASGKAGQDLRMFTPRGNRAYQFDDQYMFSPGIEGYFGHQGGGDNERTTWDFSKSVKEKSFTSEYTFDVEKTVNTVVMSVMGDCKAGEIRIKIVMPNGKNYSDILIDEFGNLNWRKSFTVSATENQDKTGPWKFKIESDKASGYFKISLQTY